MISLLLLFTAAISADESAGRVTLMEQSTVALGQPFTDWGRFLDWSSAPAVERLARHKTGPLDLDTELQEEVVLRDYEIGTAEDSDEPGQSVYPITAGPLLLYAVVGAAANAKSSQPSAFTSPTATSPTLSDVLLHTGFDTK